MSDTEPKLRTTIDLNELLISNADGPDEPLKDYRTTSVDGNTRALFKNLEEELVECIRKADVIVGCVAWLTSTVILRELSKKAGVALVVQKEDFLRPDFGSNVNWRRKLRQLYDQLPRTLTRYDSGFNGTALYQMSFAGDPSIDPIRCVGNFNSTKLPAFPRAHHKFVIFCRMQSNASPDQSNDSIESFFFEPYEVWTGSFNFTKNATYSFENAVLSKDQNIVGAFFREFGQIAALSESLDWETEWTAPDWRIGS